MFAEVYPLIRLPRRFTFFDYKIPDGMKVGVGDIVMIKLRNREILGVVRDSKKTTGVVKMESIQEIQNIILPGFFHPDDICRYEQMARSIAQSPSTIIHSAIGQMRGRNSKDYFVRGKSEQLSVSSEAVSVIKKALVDKSNYVFAELSFEGQYALVNSLRRKYKNQILVILPRERDAELISKNLDLGEHTSLLHGKTLATNRESIIKNWRSGKIETLIGTRQSTLIPANKLDAVIVMDCGSEDYAELNRNPRIDSRKSAELLAKQHNSKIFMTGFTPELRIVESYSKIWANLKQPKIIDIHEQNEYTGKPLITESLVKSISNTLQNRKSVLLSFNRKGVAKRLQCSACGHIPLCGTCGAQPIVRNDDLVCTVCKSEMWIPKTCPSCKKDKISQRGVGNKRIKKALQELFPKTKIGIIDKDEQELNAEILVATEYYFKNIYKPFQNKKFGTIASLNIDLALAGIDFRSSELALYKIKRLEHLALRENAECIIQTWLPQVIKNIERAKDFMKGELQIRNKYSLPPSVDIIKIKCGDEITEIKNPNFDEMKKIENNCIISTDLNNYEH